MNRMEAGLCLLTVLGIACGRQSERLAGSGGIGRIETKASVLDAKDKETLSALGYLRADQAQRAPAAIPAPTAAPAGAPGPRVTSALKLIWTASLHTASTAFRDSFDRSRPASWMSTPSRCASDSLVRGSSGTAGRARET